MIRKTPGTIVVSLLAVAAGVFLFRSIKCANRAERDDEARLDEMLEQSFPASDAPVY